MKKITFKIIGLFILITMIIPTTVFAHPGRLDSKGCHYCRTNCSSWGLENNEYHCHSGNTYTNSKGEVYDKSGTKISDDNSSNEETSSKEDISNNENESNNETTENKSDKPISNNSNSNNTSSNKKDETATNKPVISTETVKSKDTSLKYIRIDNQNIQISDEMSYETIKKIVEINIETNDSKSLVEFNNYELSLGKNEVIIKVTAEAGNTKEYKLTIIRNEAPSEVIIKKFLLNSSEVNFENNKANVSKLTNETSFDYEYELSDDNAKLLIYLNDREVTDLNNIKDNDVIKLVIIDNDDNKNIYEITINELSKIESFIINVIVYTIVAIVLLSPVIITGFIVYIKKRKKIKK